MAQVGNSENRSGGQYMVQDQDHMSEINSGNNDAKRSGVRQPEQSQAGGRQQGNDDQHASGQQGGERRRRSL